MATLTRAGLAQAVHNELGLPCHEAVEFVEAAIEEMAERLVAGEPVTIYGFGSFKIRFKRPRMGRNPKTGEPAEITPRRVVVFRASAKLKERVGDALGAGAEDA